jgi:hypothetical protein
VLASHNKQHEAVLIPSWLSIKWREDYRNAKGTFSEKERYLSPSSVTHPFPHIFTVEHLELFPVQYTTVVLLPAKLLVSFVLDIGKKKSCFLSFVSWLQFLFPPLSWSLSLFPPQVPESLGSPQITFLFHRHKWVSHSELSEENNFCPSRGLFFAWDHFLWLFFSGSCPRFLSIMTGRN